MLFWKQKRGEWNVSVGKVPITKPDDLSLAPGNHRVAGKNCVHKLSSGLYICSVSYMWMHVHTHIHKETDARESRKSVPCLAQLNIPENNLNIRRTAVT